MIVPPQIEGPQSPVIDWHHSKKINLLYYNIDQLHQGRLAQDLVASDQDLLSYQGTVVLDTLGEGHGPDHVLAAIDNLSSRPWFDLGKLLWIHNVFDDAPPGVHAVSWPWYMVNHCHWLDYFREIPNLCWDISARRNTFCCLVRRPSPIRSRLIRRLLEYKAPNVPVVSYGSMIDYKTWDTEANIQIPMLFDGPTPGHEQHRARDPEIFRCMINVVAETVNQDECTYQTDFVSEKTFKAMAWRQIPIWWTRPGLVQKVRTFGFDMFDDYVRDHDYDQITHATERLDRLMQGLDACIDKIQNASQRDLEDLGHRLHENWQRLLALDRSRSAKWREIINHVRDLSTVH